MQTKRAIQVHAEFYPGDDCHLEAHPHRVTCEYFDGAQPRRWQFWFTNTLQLCATLTDAQQYRGLPQCAADECVREVRTWLTNTAEDSARTEAASVQPHEARWEPSAVPGAFEEGWASARKLTVVLIVGGVIELVITVLCWNLWAGWE